MESPTTSRRRLVAVAGLGAVTVGGLVIGTNVGSERQETQAETVDPGTDGTDSTSSAWSEDAVVIDETELEHGDGPWVVENTIAAVDETLGRATHELRWYESDDRSPEGRFVHLAVERSLVESFDGSSVTEIRTTLDVTMPEVSVYEHLPNRTVHLESDDPTFEFLDAGSIDVGDREQAGTVSPYRETERGSGGTRDTRWTGSHDGVTTMGTVTVVVADDRLETVPPETIEWRTSATIDGSRPFGL